MSRSNRVTLREITQVFRLIHDARDVGHDPEAWPVVVVQGLARLIGARTVAMTCVEVSAIGRPPRAEGLADTGWNSDKERDDWARRFRDLQEFRGDLFTSRLMSIAGRLTTRSREQLVGDDEWYGSTHYNELYRPFGLHNLLLSYAKVKENPAMLGFGMDRPNGTPFQARERRLLRYFHRELNGQIDRSLVRKSVPEIKLAPRLRRTLECLLEGDRAGEIALRLGLSRHTVNEYVAELYRLHGVNSRSELMARCLRPAPNSSRNIRSA